MSSMRIRLHLQVVAFGLSVSACFGHTNETCDYYSGFERRPQGKFTCECDGKVRPPNEEESSWGAMGGGGANTGFLVSTVCDGKIIRANVPADRQPVGDAGAR